MDGYLGTNPAPADNPYVNYTAQDWALYYVMCYGQIDGSHHKQWVLDQVARILHGTPVEVHLATWHNPERIAKGNIGSFGYVNKEKGILGEYRFWTREEPSQEYLDWVAVCRGEYDEENDEYEYGYDEGIAP